MSKNLITESRIWQPLLILLIFIFLVNYSLFAQMPGMEVVMDMKIGWNLGNTLDALGGETAWGNPLTTKAMLDEVAAMGFKTVRIPVSWGEHVGSAPDYTIDPSRLSRVEEVVNYVLDNDMYAIVNLHHENEWLIPTYATQAGATEQLVAIWEQVAARFRNYSTYLVFETMNEPRVEGSSTEWSGGTGEYRDVINQFNQAALNAIRGTGGNNTQRYVMITTHAATSQDVAINDLVIPNDQRIIVSLHTYWPYYFSMDEGGTAAWGSDTDKAECDAELDRIYNFFGRNGIPVVIGEWGSINKDNTAARIVHAEYYAQAVRQRGMLSLWWDNGDEEWGGFALLNRDSGGWYFPEIAQALVRGAGGADPDATPNPTQTPFPGYDCSGVPEWDPGATYDAAGTRVQYNGSLYENKWFSQDQNPEEYSSEYEVWTLVGPCGSSGTPAPTSVQTETPTPAPTSVDETPSPTPGSVLLGDTNSDGAVDIVDALLIAQYYVGLDPVNFDQSAADVNCDSSIDIVDALLAAQYYVGLITGFC